MTETDLTARMARQTVRGERESLRLPDGRRLAWTSWGPMDGRPVLFCTGAGMSGSLGFGVPTLSGLGWRLLGIDRPGLGRSDPHPAKTLTTWIDDVRHLLRRVDGSGARAVGFSQGGPFALALAGAELVEAVALVAAQDELGRIRHLLHPDVAAMLAAAEADAADFERRIAATATADWLWNLVVGMSGERDRAFYTDSALGPAYQRALEEGFAQGSAGYARDLAIVLGRWPVPVEEIAVPVDLWYGGQDTSTVHSPDLGRTLAARLPRGRLHLLPDEGGSLLWTRAPEILAALARS